MPSSRQRSLPGRPDSTRLRAATICSSVCLFRFIGLSFQVFRKNSTSACLSFWGEGQYHKYLTAPDDQYDQVIDEDPSGDVGRDPDIYFHQPHQKAHICYYDAANGDLKYATAFGDITVSTIDSIGDVGQNCSIGVNSSGHVYISYYDATNQDLKLAQNTGLGTAFTIRTIDSTGNQGKWSSLLIDPDDALHIAYFSAGGAQDLKYFYESPTYVDIVIVDEDQSTGRYCEILLGDYDSDEDVYGVHFSYYHAGFKNLNYNYGNIITGFTGRELVDGPGKVGRYSTIIKNLNSGLIEIFYEDATNKTVKQATQ